MNRVVLVSVGVIITLAGVVFTLQGVGVVGGSAMSGVTFWAVAGPLIVVAGSLYLIGEALEVLGVSPAGTGERGLNEWSGRSKAD